MFKRAAHAMSHLFFGYLRSLASPRPKIDFGIPALPKSLSGTLLKTEYPPRDHRVSRSAARIYKTRVDYFSPNPEASIARASHLPYRDQHTLRRILKLENSARPFSTLECHRILETISNNAKTSPWINFISNEFTGSLVPLDKLDANLRPAGLSSVKYFEMDETFWWVWMTSLGPEEPPQRQAIFRRCSLVEAHVSHDRREWVIIEESLQAPSPSW